MPIDRELLAQVMRSHIDQAAPDTDLIKAMCNDAGVMAYLRASIELFIEHGDADSAFGSVLSRGFELGREYESLSGREYRSKLTEPFGGL